VRTRGRFVFALALLVAEFDARSWDALYDTFHRFGHRDDRRVAAGLTHSVV
jgi:hypothetical protein